MFLTAFSGISFFALFSDRWSFYGGDNDWSWERSSAGNTSSASDSFVAGGCFDQFLAVDITDDRRNIHIVAPR